MRDAPSRPDATPEPLPLAVREPLERARLLAIQMENPAVQTYRWAPKLTEWLDQANFAARGSQEVRAGVANTVRDASVLVRVLSESSPRDVKTYLPELVTILDELLGPVSPRPG